MSALRLSAIREQLRTSLWFWPALAVTGAIVVGTALPMLEPGSTRSAPGFAGTPEGARAILATVAGSTITVTGLTFSLTVVALQVASSQFTPRLMRTFLSDRGNQAVLSVFLGTFAYTLAVLRSVRSSSEAGGSFVPDIAVALGLALTVLSVAMLVYFFHHLTQQLRVESVLAELQRDTARLARDLLPLREDDGRAAPELPDVHVDATPLRALRTGYLQTVDGDRLRQVAIGHGVVLVLRPVVGGHVTQGSTVAWAVPLSESGALVDRSVDLEALTRDLHGGIHLGRERTLQQDVAFGIRQLVDIVARALSPGINDPATAVAAIGSLAAVLAELTGRRLDPIVRTDDEGRVRAVAPQPTFAEILALACDQPRRYGRSEPAVLTELLRMLTDLSERKPGDEAREAIRGQIAATVGVAESAGLSDAELSRVYSVARHARAALARGHRVAVVPAEAPEPAP